MLSRFVMTLLLAAAVLAAGEVEMGPRESPVPAWQHLWNGLVPSDRGQRDDAGIVVNNPVTRGEAADLAGPEPTRDWGDDVLVAETTRAFDGRISVDNDDLTGDIYVCLLNRDTTFDDTAYIWRSTDGGATWLDHPGIHGDILFGDINDAQILCGHGPGDTTWLYIVSADSKAKLRIRRTNPDASVWHWVMIDTSSNIVRVALDRNIEDPEHLFCVWEEDDGDLRAMSSTDAGETWVNAAYIATDRRDVSFAAGGDGYGYVAYMDAVDSTYLRIGRFKNNLVTPNWTFNTVDTDPTRRFREVAIAADRSVPGDSQTAIALATYRLTNSELISPRYAWTLNGGVSWSSSSWPVTNQTRETWLARFPRIRRPYDDSLFHAIVSMPETTTSWDTIVYAQASGSDPETWFGRGEYNDHRNTSEVSHDVGYSGLVTGGLIAYRQYGSGRAWFDGCQVTGIGAGPMPVQPGRIATIFGGGANLTLPKRSRVRASVYDRSGRLVRELVNGTLDAGEHRLDLGGVSGVRFLRVTVDGRAETAKLVRIP